MFQKKQKVLIFLLIISAGIFAHSWYTSYENQKLQEQIAGKILRFHVLANSDTTSDQELKIKVRDAVGTYMETQMTGVSSLEESEEVVTKHLADITSIAKNVVMENGYSYDVFANLGEADFPVKTYGDYTFPAGTYEALNIVIGEGEGQNWWCVMYPNMCFRGSVYEVVDDNAKENLKEVLSQEEYEAVLEKGDYEVQFRYLKSIFR